MNTTDKKVWVRALTIATIAAAGAFLSGCSLLGQVDNITGGDTTDGDDDVFQIKVGECFNDETPEGETVSEVQKVDCAEPHIWEAYKSIIIDEGDGTYPGEEVVTAQVRDRLQGRLRRVRRHRLRQLDAVPELLLPDAGDLGPDQRPRDPLHRDHDRRLRHEDDRFGQGHREVVAPHHMQKGRPVLRSTGRPFSCSHSAARDTGHEWRWGELNPRPSL